MSASLRVVGIDPSLTSTGVATAAWSLAGTAGVMVPDCIRVQSSGRAGASLPERSDRLAGLAARIAELASGADLVVIEGPSMGSTAAKSASMHDRAGLWWLVVDALRQDPSRPVLVAEVPPTIRAKYATGNGGAGKDAVLAAAVKRYPGWDITGNDIADAVILTAMGCRHLGHPIDSLPQIHLTAMAKVHWPESTTPGETA